MDEQELIFLGAALLLAPRLPKKITDPENDPDIEQAVAQAHFLLAEVKKWEKIGEESRTRRFHEVMKRLAERV